jgi:dynamin 1-like protein
LISKQHTLTPTTHLSFLDHLSSLQNRQFHNRYVIGFLLFSLLTFFKPESLESVNGYKPLPEDEEETFSDDTTGANDIFPPRDGRSVSSTLHDRSRSNVSTAVSTTKPPANSMATVAKRSSSKSRMHRASHGGESIHQSRPPPPPAFGRGENSSMNTGSTPPPGSARETFLNYFFGQNGPGPIAGSSIERSHQHNHGHGGSSEGHFVPVGRDVSGGESSMSTGLMAGQRGIDGNNAAYDMKSLGRHIEAVSRKEKKNIAICSFDNFQLVIGLWGRVTADNA